MHFTLLWSALAALAAASPAPYKRQAQGMEIEIKFGPGLVPMGLSTDTINSGFEQANTVCDWQSCNPGVSVQMAVSVVLPRGVYPQADEGDLTIQYTGAWDTFGQGDNSVRDTLITEMRQAAVGVATMKTVTVRTKIGSSGKSCEINPAACRDDEYEDFNVYTVPNIVQLIARRNGEIVGDMKAELSIKVPKLNLGPFTCDNAQTYVEKVFSNTPVVAQVVSGVCTIVGILT